MIRLVNRYSDLRPCGGFIVGGWGGRCWVGKANHLSKKIEVTMIRPVLKELHWLPTEQRITFKVLLLTFKGLNNLAPPYLSQLIVPYNPTRNLRSAGKHLLQVPNVRLKSYGSRAFSVAVPKHWNEIPLDIKLSRSVDVFRLAFKWLFVLLLLLVRYLLDCKAL